MELFLRIQQKDSGVPSAVESIEHPGEPSYLLNQPTGLTPPTPESCRLYAAAAARVGIALEKYDRKRPPAYRESALRAMSWVESNPGAPDIYGFDASQLGESANLAAVWMYRLTGEAKWHAEAIRTFRLVHGDEGKVRLDRTRYSQGLWVLFPEAPAGPSLRARAAPRRIGANLWLTNRGGKTCQDGAWRAFGVSLRSLMRRGPRNSAGSSILTRPSVDRQIKASDGTDGDALSAYAPYMDVVCTDAFMADQLRDAAKEYGFKLFHAKTMRLREMKAYLESCLSGAVPIRRPSITAFVLPPRERREESANSVRRLGLALRAMGMFGIRRNLRL